MHQPAAAFVAAALAALAALPACRGNAADGPTSRSAATVPDTAPDRSSRPTGVLTMRLTKPLDLDATAPAQVTCRRVGERLHVSATDVELAGFRVNLTQDVEGNRADVDLKVVAPGGVSHTATVASAPARVEPGGDGSVELATGETTGSIGWKCSP